VPGSALLPQQIELRGVEVHNLKQVDVDIPLGKLVVVCGVSGSGKTSLALDTLYAEGQRRYIESFSAYTRQFLDRLEKPAAERIDHIPPAVAVAATTGVRSSRATVGTSTELSDYLRLVFARIGRLVCPQCGIDVRRESPQSVGRRIEGVQPGARFMIAAPLARAAGPEGGDSDAALRELRESGFIRVIVGDRVVRLEDRGSDTAVDGARDMSREVLVVIDRLIAGEQAGGRVRDSLETAFRQGDGQCVVLMEADGREQDERWEDPASRPMSIDGRTWRRFDFRQSRACARCGMAFEEPEPRLFSFNSPLGACPRCEGIGTVAASESGTEDAVCPACEGRRLRPEALNYRVGGKQIAEVLALRVTEARRFLGQIELDAFDREVARSALEQVQSRLAYLESVGLEYLTLDRPMRSLSGGEAHRAALTTALGTSLVNLLYVLDEPSVGLHPRDVERLLGTVRELRERGNTVVVIEHEESILRAADHLIELGPGAGHRGGEVVFSGVPRSILDARGSMTGDYLAGRRGAAAPASRRPLKNGWLRLTGARGHNLQNISVDFPLGVLCVVTGVSGAGKSSLVQDTLFGAVRRRKRKDGPAPLPFDDLIGLGPIADAVLVDQHSVGRSPRSNPVTYVKAFDSIRAVFAETTDARTHNYGPSHFSFNCEEGRCSECRGEGLIPIDMQFLADVYRKCARCRGARYRKEILAVAYRGRSIADVLEMTVREASSFFRGHAKVLARLNPLIDVGLDYLRLGQPANTLSGGESQRLRLAGCLATASRKRTLFLMDEPTTGLHFADIVRMLDCFETLLDAGHSLIVVEHNLQLIKAADHVIDLGPGAGELGGRVVAAGTPEEVASRPESITGRWIAAALDGARA